MFGDILQKSSSKFLKFWILNTFIVLAAFFPIKTDYSYMYWE